MLVEDQAAEPAIAILVDDPVIRDVGRDRFAYGTSALTRRRAGAASR